MLYNSTEFVIFFAAICLILYLVPHKARNLYLLIVSYIFCAMYSPVFVPFLAVMALFSYIAGRAIERSRKTWAFALVLIVLFAPLAFLKYYAFFASLLTEGLGAMHIRVSIPALTLVQPVGLSFYSFMAGGYLIDVWKGKISAERNILRYALFLSFFPTQSAGPIERADLFLPQLEKKRPFSWDGVQTGPLGLHREVRHRGQHQADGRCGLFGLRVFLLRHPGPYGASVHDGDLLRLRGLLQPGAWGGQGHGF